MGRIILLWSLVWASLGLLLGADTVLAADRLGKKAAADDPLAGLSKSLPKDPAHIFHWVRDNIRYECYAGSLRGPLGTYWARAGNALDKSDLLVTLLRRAGHECRIARGRLPQEQARELILSMFPAGVPELDVGAMLAGDEKLTALLGRLSPGSDVRSALDKLPKSQPDQDPRLLAEAQDHFWVELRAGGRWEPLDPSLRRMEPGMRQCEAETTFAAIPQELRHTLTIRVEGEVAAASEAKRQVLLTQQFAVSELPGKAIRFTHCKETSARGETFQPVLGLGETEYAGKRVYGVSPSGAKLAGERVLFESAAPGQASRVDPYVVFEAGEKKPLAEVLARQHTFVVAPGLMGPDVLKQKRFTAPPAKQDPLDQAPTLPLIGKLPTPREMRTGKTAMEEGPLVWDLQFQLGLMVLVQCDAAVTRAARRIGASTYPDTPRVSAVRTGSIVTQYVANGFRPVIRPGQPACAAASLRTAVALAADMAQAAALQRVTGRTPVSATTVMRCAARANIPTKTFGPSNVKELERSVLSSATRARIRAAVSRGQTVIATERPVPMDGGNHEAHIAVNWTSGATELSTDGDFAGRAIDSAKFAVNAAIHGAVATACALLATGSAMSAAWDFFEGDHDGFKFYVKVMLFGSSLSGAAEYATKMEDTVEFLTQEATMAVVEKILFP